MKKILFLSLIILLTLSAIVSAQTPDLEIKKTDQGSTIIKELMNPAIFNFEINNKGDSDLFEIYSLVGVSMSPKGKFNLAHGKNTIEVMAFPSTELRKNNNGFYKFEYQLKGRNSGIFKDFLLIKIVPLEDALIIEPEPLHPSNSEITIKIRNKENAHLINLIMDFDSLFFSTRKVVSLKPKEETNFSVSINKENLEEISAGPYIVTTNVNLNDEKTKLEGIINYLENEGTKVERTAEGFILNKKTVKKTNIGNVLINTEIRINKNIISRLFTINSPQPTKTEREGLGVTYIWEKPLSPNETLEVNSTTNYTFPFILLILIVLAGFLARKYTQKALSINKRVSFVKTRKGEFALKINLQVKAKKHVDKIQLIDTIPAIAKLYEKFGHRPDKIDNNSRRLFWNINSLQAGEERVFSYIIYSKLNIIGRFELSAATAVFEHEGKTQEVWSNKAYFASEKN